MLVSSTDEQHGDALSDELTSVYDELAAIDADEAPSRAASLLHELGFDEAKQRTPTRSLSGGKFTSTTSMMRFIDTFDPMYNQCSMAPAKRHMHIP
jgi:hypothetical protein